MEQNDPNRRQYLPLGFASQQAQQGTPQAQVPFTAPGSVERFRQSSFLQQSPGAPSPSGRPSAEQQVYGYGQSTQYGGATGAQAAQMQYGQDIQTPEAQRQGGQQFPQYGSNVLYGMAQPQAAQQAQSPYEQMSQYRPRTNTGSETYAAPYGVPQTAQYYLAAQPGTTSASTAELAPPQIPQYQQPDAYPQPGPSTAQAYPSAMMDPTQSAAYATFAQQPQYNPQQPAAPVDHAFDRYQNQVRNIFSLTNNGSLRDVGTQLLEISYYLLPNAEALGLTRDDEALHDDRIRLWDEFNRAWLITLQRQFDLTQLMLHTNQSPREPQSVMSSQTLERLSTELVRLCDSIERHGLVDYQMGVAEEEIMDLLLRCLALLDALDERAVEAGQQPESSSAGAARAR